MSPVLKRLLIAFVCWRVVIQFFAWISPHFFQFQPTYPYYDAILEPKGPWWLMRWGGFDGVHYVTIAARGYFGTGLIQAFFPVYPLLMSVGKFFGNVPLFGLFLAHGFAIAAAIVWIRLLKQEKLSIVGGLLAFATFATSFYFIALYTESLFLFLVVSAWYAAINKKWRLAILCTMIATATRVTGVLFLPTLWMEAYIQHKKGGGIGIPWKRFLWISFGALGLVCYMLFLWAQFGDPIYFFHVQQAFNTGRQESLVLFPQVVYRYMKILFTASKTWLYYASAQEFFLMIEAGLLLSWATLKKGIIRRSLLFYGWLSYIFPSLTGTFQSMPRYLLVVFPLFMIFAKLYERKPKLFILIALIHAILLAINIVLFIQGRWVA